jgi:hypothetical protein
VLAKDIIDRELGSRRAFGAWFRPQTKSFLSFQLLEKEAIRAAERTAPHPLGKTNMVVVSRTPTRQAKLSMQAALRESLAKQVRKANFLFGGTVDFLFYDNLQLPRTPHHEGTEAI